MGQGGGKEAEDPSMEDILASIRRILNDDEPAAEGAHAAPAAAEADIAAPLEPALDDVFVLDESMLVAEPSASAALPVAAPPAPAPVAARPPPAPPPEPPIPLQQAIPTPMIQAAPSQPAPADHEEALISASTAAAASASMGALVRVVGQQQTPVYRGGPTLEDMVRDEIRPLVKSWLEEHLAPMVERMVRAEIARVTEGK